MLASAFSVLLSAAEARVALNAVSVAFAAACAAASDALVTCAACWPYMRPRPRGRPAASAMAYAAVWALVTWSAWALAESAARDATKRRPEARPCAFAIHFLTWANSAAVG